VTVPVSAEMNALALNLADDVITGTRAVDDARTFCAGTATAFMKGKNPPCTPGSLCDAPSGDTADLDRTTMGRWWARRWRGRPRR
jgi:hypothetical protein